jgi:hypothetical protein
MKLIPTAVVLLHGGQFAVFECCFLSTIYVSTIYISTVSIFLTAGTFNKHMFQLQFLYMRGESLHYTTTLFICLRVIPLLCLRASAYTFVQLEYTTCLTQKKILYFCVYCTFTLIYVETWKLLKHQLIEIWMHFDIDV